MPVDVFGKLGSVLVGIKDMKAASIKSKTEWRFLGVAFEDAHDHEATGSIGCCCFFSLACSKAMSEASIPTTWKPSCASQIAFVPVPHPISNALQDLIGVEVTVLMRLKSGLPTSQGGAPSVYA